MVSTPTNSKVKMSTEGEMKIYSESPKVTPDLMDKFDKANDENATELIGYQFGLSMLAGSTTALIAIAMAM